MKICIIQARSSSKRLPNKVLMKFNNETVIERMVRICSQITGIDQVVIATSTDPSDDAIEQVCGEKNIQIFRGDLNNVLKRFYDCATQAKAKHILRVTADCPLLDPQVASQVLYLLIEKNLDYCSNVSPVSWPDGMDCEAFSIETLERIYKGASRPSHFEHVTSYVHENLSQFKTANLNCPVGDLSQHRWTLDYKEDYDFLNQIVDQFNGQVAHYLEVLKLIREKQITSFISPQTKRNEGFQSDHQTDTKKLNFSTSQQKLKEVETLIPVGSQTFSKSKYQYPPGHAPLFLSHGRGSQVWDVDGNQYTDLVNGLLPVVLGYCDYDVDQAIREQLNFGISFSLATDLEMKLAQKLNQLIPSAEMIRFGKNGSDATSACVRLARAFTGRDRVMTCGYHGWHDWYIGSTTRNKGIPQAVTNLTAKVPYNDLKAVDKLLNEHKNQFACMIMEPMNVTEPEHGYLSDLKTLLHKHGTLLVFDEVITGFRFHLGGAQSLFEVTPDLAAFGKAMANGMPLSAITGRKDIMMEMDAIFYSGTFAGECLSLAASLAVIEKFERENVIKVLWENGTRITDIVNKWSKEYNLQEFFGLMGAAPWMIWNTAKSNQVDPMSLKSFMLFEMINNGILTLGSHNVSYAMTEADFSQIDQTYKQCFSQLSKTLSSGNLEESLEYKIEPIFKVR